MKLVPDKHLHSREHLLADDLSRLMLEPKKFAAYLGVAKMYYEPDLRALAKQVAAKPDLDPRNRGRYFFGALRRLQKKVVWIKKAANSTKAANDAKGAKAARAVKVAKAVKVANDAKAANIKKKNGKTADRKIAKQRS